MAAVAPALSVGSSSIESISEKIEKRESNELVVAFSGPAGSGTSSVLENAKEILEGQFGYVVRPIKLSKFIEKFSEKLGTPLDITQPFERYSKLQTAGNDLRARYHNDILAELAISKIASERVAASPESSGPDAVPPRVAYVIDQLKHPAEVELLRSVYGNMFLLVGVLASENQRKKRLHGENITEENVASIMERDRNENFKHGQKLEKTLQLADLFIRNSHSNREAIKKQLERFFELVHGQTGISPTNHEYGMYVAYSAGLKSACLSRQVGAAIATVDGSIVSTGCNDVPRSGGGLYGQAGGADDQRCYNKENGKCFNDHHKNKVAEEIYAILRECDVDADKAKKITGLIREDTKLKDLIEFSRAVHAEMDAIVAVARNGKEAIKNGILYTTTFPCHNCARHIVASGIMSVFYIEPYEKSLASTLHDDAIDVDPDEGGDGDRVRFIHFDGVAPRKYQDFFVLSRPRKDTTGKAVFYKAAASAKTIPQYLDSYQDIEARIAKHLKEMGVPQADVIA